MATTTVTVDAGMEAEWVHLCGDVVSEPFPYTSLHFRRRINPRLMLHRDCQRISAIVSKINADFVGLNFPLIAKNDYALSYEPAAGGLKLLAG